MAKDIYEQMKELMSAKVDDISINELDDIALISENLNIEENTLKAAFNEVITSREALFSEIEKLIITRTESYQTVITILYLSYFFDKVIHYIETDVTIWYTLLQFARSQEFSDVIRNLKSYISTPSNMTSTKTTQFQDYFQSNFDTLLTLSGRDLQMLQTTDGPKLQEYLVDVGSDPETFSYQNIDIEDQENADNYLFYVLGYLATAETAFFDASHILPITNIIETSERNLGSVTFEKLDDAISEARDNLKRFMILDTHRKENDASYTGTYTQDIYDKIELYDFYLSRFAGIDQKTMEELHEDGTFSLLFLTKEDITSEINTLSYETIQSIDTINMFLEKYAMFVKLPEDSINQLEKTIDELLVTYKDNLSEDADNEYFTAELIDEPDLSAFIAYMEDDLLNANDDNILFFKDYYNLIILYTGLKLKEYDFTYNLNYINYAIKNLVTKTEVHRDEINNVAFTDLKTIEENLAETYGIHIRDIVNNELIDPTIKLIYPKLTLLDLVDIDLLIDNNIGYADTAENLYWEEQGVTAYYDLDTDKWMELDGAWSEVSGNMPDDLAEFINTIYMTILESILSKRTSLNKIIASTLRAYAQRGYNFKSVFVEMIIRKAFARMLSYVSGKDTILENSTISLMSSYLSSEIDEENEKILHEYKVVRSAFYTAEENLIEKILVDGNAFRTYLETFYE